jgi:NAD(P)-dependent dehydrogenase (short-subunit alcohol dehydrogenase family)
MKINGSVALVTGANRGLGRAFARELVSRGAAKVYGAARHPDAVTDPGVTPVGLDITDAERVAQVARQCADVSLLVNNAGVLKYSTFINAPSLDAARTEMETNYFGTVAQQTFDAVEAGQVEVLADERTRTIKAELSRDQELIYPPVREFWDGAVKGTS